MSDDDEADRGPAGYRMIHVRPTDDGDAVGVGIYAVHPDGHPSVPGSRGQEVGELMAAIRLSDPEDCFALARRISLEAIALEERRKNK